MGHLTWLLHNIYSVSYRIESNSIVKEIFDTYRIVLKAYRYTPTANLSDIHAYLQKLQTTKSVIIAQILTWSDMT